nr:hypothetical protein [Methylorubrum zatmanii]
MAVNTFHRAATHQLLCRRHMPERRIEPWRDNGHIAATSIFIQVRSDGQRSEVSAVRGSKKRAVESFQLKRDPRTDFAVLARNAAAGDMQLPLTHVTDGYSFRSIIETGALKPTHCKVFDSDLLYLFYGRPAYRAAAEAESNGSEAYWPICIVMSPRFENVKRIYPFDSGAFHHRKFADFMYHKMIKEDFQLDIDPSMPGRIVRLYWKDERSYFNVKGYSDFAPGALEFEAKAYSNLIRHVGKAPFDERNSAIEIQFDQQILLKDNTLAVILPYEFATEQVLSKINQIGAVALPFDMIPRHGNVETVGHIYNIVRDLLGGKLAEGRGQCW